jgi:hypothetical protein
MCTIMAAATAQQQNFTPKRSRDIAIPTLVRAPPVIQGFPLPASCSGAATTHRNPLHIAASTAAYREFN